MTTGKVWFITGASSGFGRIWAEAALKRGDQVVATARDPKVLSGLVQTNGDNVLALPLDVTDRAAVFDTVKQAHSHFGRLDVILSNAGYGYMSSVEEIDPIEAKANFETNFFGTLSVIQAALPFLRKQKSGHILTLSSIGGIVGFPTGGTYPATKFAVEALSEALAGEVSGFGIKVTIIEPGTFSTGFRSAVKSSFTQPEYQALREKIHSSFTPEMSGDPQATVPAIFKLVDSNEPPLRLILGSWALPLAKKTYEDRIKTWEKWADVSNAAQGAKATVS